jgi:hypothetical protein
MIPKSGNRFSEKIMRPGKSGIASGNSISPATRQALGCGGLPTPHLGPQTGFCDTPKENPGQLAGAKSIHPQSN